MIGDPPHCPRFAKHGCTHLNKEIKADPRLAGLIERWGDPTHLGKVPAVGIPVAAVLPAVEGANE